MPCDSVGLAPCGDLQIARVGKGVAGFLMRVQATKGRFLPDGAQHIGQLTGVYFDAAAVLAQCVIQRIQRFAYKLEVLQRGVRLQPQRWLDHIDTT